MCCLFWYSLFLVINIFLCTNNGLLTNAGETTATPCVVVMHTVFIFLEFLVVNAIPTNDMIRRTPAEREREKKRRVSIIPSDDSKSHKYGSLIPIDWLKKFMDRSKEWINEWTNEHFKRIRHKRCQCEPYRLNTMVGWCYSRSSIFLWK